MGERAFLAEKRCTQRWEPTGNGGNWVAAGSGQVGYTKWAVRYNWEVDSQGY